MTTIGPLRKKPRLDDAAWLNATLLLLVGRFDAGAHDLRVSTAVGGRSLALDASNFAYVRPGDRKRSGRRRLLVARLPVDEAGNGGPASANVVVQVGRVKLQLGPAELSTLTSNIEPLIESDLAELDAKTRAALLDFVLETVAPDLDGPDGYTLGMNLHRLREAMRETQPIRTITGEEPLSVNVDRIMAVDDKSFWVRGWVRDQQATATQVTAISPEGLKASLLEGAFRHPRPDVEELYGGSGMEAAERHGLINYIQLPFTTRLATGWIAELRTVSGGVLEVEIPPVVRDFASVRETILKDTREEAPRSYELTEKHAHPALAQLQGRLREAVRIESVVQFGTPGRPPGVSIIVPLYGRIDFLQHQLAQFVQDREIPQADLIYVLDSPELRDPLHKEAAELHEFYGVPFRIVTLNRNGGFSNANNNAVSVARGRLLVLLNSDVFPDRPGWLGKMTAFYDATPNIGALGPKLLYEDDSLQHAGMYFQREAESTLWGNQHYFKGFHRAFPEANVARPVPATTGACLMIDRTLYEELGGLRHTFVQGGYEDSDLCLRLIEAGRQNWYLPAAELYHFEDQSYPSSSEARKLVTRYNTGLQTHLWGERIEELMRNEPMSTDVHGTLALAS
jgi:O-antigen biosynthesis protein